MIFLISILRIISYFIRRTLRSVLKCLFKLQISFLAIDVENSFLAEVIEERKNASDSHDQMEIDEDSKASILEEQSAIGMHLLFLNYSVYFTILIIHLRR